MTGQSKWRWFGGTSLSSRFHIMLAVMLLSEALIIGGAVFAMRDQVDASAELARVAAVQRALDSTQTLRSTLDQHLLTSPGAGTDASGEQLDAGYLVDGLRAQLAQLWSLPKSSEVATAIENVRQPANDYVSSVTAMLRQNTAGAAATWGFAEIEPRRTAFDTAVADAMARMRNILHRIESRVLQKAGELNRVTLALVALAIGVGAMLWLMFWLAARSIATSIQGVGEVAQALAAGDMDNRCETHGAAEINGLARMINLLADTMQGMLTRLRSEASRSTFSNQLVEALEMADSEAEADRVIARAMGAISDVHPMELLLADSSRAHLERACAHPKTGAPNCAVESPYSCIAVRRGYAQVFSDAEALNACPKLLGRMGGSMSAACVPVNFMGRALGVLHVTGAKGKPPNAEQIAQLTALGVHAGTRIGTLRAFERSQLQASTDSLTGLTNRRAGEEVLSNLMAVDSAFAVVMSDLDFFKRLNDTQGHEAGDRALKLFADTARIGVRDRDHVVRWGGEEFALLLPGANAEHAMEVVERLRAALAEAQLMSGTPAFTASFGIADSTMARDRETVVRLADEALYRSKQAGRDRCTLGDPLLPAMVGPRRERDQGAIVDITQVARG